MIEPPQFLFKDELSVNYSPCLYTLRAASEGGRGRGGASSHPGAGEPHSLVAHIKLRVVDTNEDISQDPERVFRHIQALEPTDTVGLLLQGEGAWHVTVDRGVAKDVHTRP